MISVTKNSVIETVFARRKGQSAIEYLMTYGWMLLVVAVVGGVVFSFVQGQDTQSVSGFSGDSVGVKDFSLTSDGDMEMELRNTDAERVKINSINISGNGDSIKVENTTEIPVGGDEVLKVGNATQASSTNSYDVRINYSRGKLDNLVVQGSITGSFDLNSTESDSESVTQEPSLNVETVSASEINSSSATLEGEVLDSGSEDPEVGFYYSDNQSDLNQTEAAGQSVNTFNTTVSGLDSNETYYYRAYANTTDEKVNGTVESFRTSLDFTTESIDVTSSGNGYKTMWEVPSANVTSAELDVTLYQPTRYFGVWVRFDQGGSSNYEIFQKTNNNGGLNKGIYWRNESQTVYNSGDLGSSTSRIDINVTENGDNMTVYFRETGDTVSSEVDNFNRIYYDGDDGRHSASVTGNITYYK